MSLVALGPTVLVTNGNSPAKNLMDFVRLARDKPGSMNYGTAGPGTLGHLGGEMMKRLANIDMVHVPYKGGVLAIQDLLGGQVQLVFADPQPILQHVRVGKAKALAVSGSKRLPVISEVPTLAEAGLPGFTAENWWGVWVPPSRNASDACTRALPSDDRQRPSPEIRREGIEAPREAEALREFARAEGEVGEARERGEHRAD